MDGHGPFRLNANPISRPAAGAALLLSGCKAEIHAPKSICISNRLRCTLRGDSGDQVVDAMILPTPYHPRPERWPQQ